MLVLQASPTSTRNVDREGVLKELMKGWVQTYGITKIIHSKNYMSGAVNSLTPSTYEDLGSLHEFFIAV